VAQKLTELVNSGLQQHVTRKEDRTAVETFYRERGFAPIWVAGTSAAPRATAAMAYLRAVEADGLDPADYPAPNFAGDAEALALAEIKLTNSVLNFIRHASVGRVNFTRVSDAIYFDLKAPDPAATLRTVASSDDIRKTLDSFNPQHPGYKALKTELARERSRTLRTDDRELLRIPDGEKLRPGKDDPRVPVLRKRFDLPAANNNHYDAALVTAVKDFQDRHGMSDDGVLGAATIAKLNAELATRTGRVDTLRANMERWRWMPRDVGTTYVMVNVPDYTLKVIDQGQQKWTTKIVVGKPGKLATPLITETMKFITVNPTWNVPPSIIRNEYLPALARDPYALTRAGLKMGRNSDGSIRIYQPPGEKNALGRIRFNFPNRFLVYQHDTPSKHLFDKDVRAFSHGCMRVQNPDDYAQVLLSIALPEERYTADRIRKMYGGGERTISFKKQIPVLITYQTAFVDDSGKLQTRADIYGHDKEIVALLREDKSLADRPIARKPQSTSKPVMARAKPRARTVRTVRRDDFFYSPPRRDFFFMPMGPSF